MSENNKNVAGLLAVSLRDLSPFAAAVMFSAMDEGQTAVSRSIAEVLNRAKVALDTYVAIDPTFETAGSDAYDDGFEIHFDEDSFNEMVEAAKGTNQDVAAG